MNIHKLNIYCIFKIIVFNKDDLFDESTLKKGYKLKCENICRKKKLK